MMCDDASVVAMACGALLMLHKYWLMMLVSSSGVSGFFSVVITA